MQGPIAEMITTGVIKLFLWKFKKMQKRARKRNSDPPPLGFTTRR